MKRPSPIDLLAQLGQCAENAPVEIIPDLIETITEMQATLARRLKSEYNDAPRRRGQSLQSRNEDCYLSVRELSERIPYAEQTVRNLMTVGILQEGTHYFKNRGRVMFDWQAMSNWVRSPNGAPKTPTQAVRRRRGR